MQTTRHANLEDKNINAAEEKKPSDCADSKSQPLLGINLPEKKWENLSFTAEDALNIIKSENALVKVIESKLGDDSHWVFLLQQLCYPYLYRPVHTLADYCDRKEVLCTIRFTYSTRDIRGPRGRYKLTEYT